MAEGALDGIKVIEFGHYLLVPAATAILADWGADVIKIENFKAGGDPVRFPQAIEGQMPPAGIKPSLWFHYFNRNKRSIGIDVKQERGREIMCKLVESADVFATNFDLRAVASAKADYDTLREVNPRLVYCQCTGFGTRGPDKYNPGFEYAAFWGRSGMVDRLSAPGQAPCPKPPGLGDKLASPTVAGAIAAALYCRERTGVGQKVEFSLYHYAVWGLSVDIGTALNQGINLPQTDRRAVENALCNWYRAKDGKWILLAMPQTDKYWPSFCEALGKPEWENDPRFDSHSKRMKESRALIAALDGIMASRTVAEWEAIAQEHDIVLGRIQTPVEVANDPQAWENDFFLEMGYSPGIRFKMINSPVKFSETPAAVRTLAPDLGQHTKEVLQDLGYSQDEIAELEKQGTIG